MLNRLFGATNRYDHEEDQRTRHLLHGGVSDLGGIITNADELRVLVAQDLGDKSKVMLFDSDHRTEHKPAARGHAGAGASKRGGPSSDLLCELMFGSVPLSYKGTSVRLHPLSIQNSGEVNERRLFLFTKVFSVRVDGSEAHSPSASSGTTSLSSSYQSNIGKEYPFPTMTPIQDKKQASRSASQERDHMSARGLHTPAINAHGQQTTLGRRHERVVSSSSRFAERRTSISGRTDTEVAPHVPFSKAEASVAAEDYFSGWLPSPGPTIHRRRRSIDTSMSLSPGPRSSSKYQNAICAIGIVFSVPGDGQHHSECVLLGRYWRIITRAMYSLQSTVSYEIESALNFVANHGALQTPRTRCRLPNGEARVYLRGKKYHVALASYSLSEDVNVRLAVDRFCARMNSGLKLPNVVERSLDQEADILMEQLAYVTSAFDRKECKFLFSMIITYLSEFVTHQRTSIQRHQGGLFDRLLILSDNTILARRLVYCITRLFFRAHTANAISEIDYSLVWPSSGLLGVRKKTLLQKRRSSMAKATRVNKALDIPGLKLDNEPDSLPQVSPSAFHRPPSTSSNQSSKNSSWKPGWSWFANTSRVRLADESSNRSDQRTMQTSWDSTDFNEIGRSLRSKSSLQKTTLVRESSTETSDSDDDETESTFTCSPINDIRATKLEDGTVDVELLDTVSLWSDSDSVDRTPMPVQPSFSMTGVVSCFHPDMFLQAIPSATYNEDQIKDYLSEEDFYLPEPTSSTWRKISTITIIEACQPYRVRKITRSTRSVAIDDSDAIIEEDWTEEIMTAVNESLVSCITTTMAEYKKCRNTQCIANMILALSGEGT